MPGLGGSFFQHRLSGVPELRQRVRPFRAAPFSALTERGTRTAAGVFALTGRLLSQHRLSGVLEPRTRFTLSGRQSFSLNLSGELRSAERGDSPRPAAGECADAARAHKRVDTCGFHPLVNHPFPLEGLTQITDM